MSEEVTAASFEQCIEALSHVDRRRLLVSLLDGTTNGDQATDLERIGADSGAEAPGLRMHHVHLPKLEGSGFVRTDEERQSVKKGPRFNEIEPLLKVLHENREHLPDDWV